MPRRGAAGGAPLARRRLRSTRGNVSIQLVILFPLALTMIFLAVQAAAYYHGRSVAIAAAQEGARSGAAFQAAGESGQGTAVSFATQPGFGGSLAEVDATESRDNAAGTVTVTVTGRTLSVIPGWDPVVTQSATRPLERFSAPEDFQTPPDRYADEPIVEILE